MSEYIETTIESLSHDGRGVTSINNKATFVSGALPQEKVRCKITKKHRRYNEAQTVEVLSPAHERTAPDCLHFGICGGCSMQHVTIEAQLQFKQQALLEQLKHFGKVTPEIILPPITGNPFGYRRKARLGVRYVIKKEKLLVGFREKFSNYLADIEQCTVLHPSVGTRLMELSQLIRGLSQYDQIAQIEVAVSDTETALIFRHMTPLTENDLAALSEFGQKNHFHIYLQPNPPAVVHKIWPLNTDDMLSYSLPDYQLEMRFHPLDFTQVNGEINRLMIQQALKLLDLKSTDTVLDLFCGLGNFTLPIARHAKEVIGVEGSVQMVERATANAQHNHISNTKFYAANLMEPGKQAPWLQPSYDKILLDPPRTGAKEIIPFIAMKSAKRIVYVSCNPATLARDAGELVYNHRYTLRQVGVINMFPHTSHIEAIALFER
jgi:23S rRNA (uracil1939-C5)-methyltransferase